jgi:hypothetical protein
MLRETPETTVIAAGAAPRRDVRDLVCHDPSEFRFIVGFQNEPRIDEENSPGKGRCIHILGIYHLNRKRHLCVGVADQVLANTVHVLGNDWILDDLRFPLYLLRHLLAQRDLFLE